MRAQRPSVGAQRDQRVNQPERTRARLPPGGCPGAVARGAGDIARGRPRPAAVGPQSVPYFGLDFIYINVICTEFGFNIGYIIGVVVVLSFYIVLLRCIVCQSLGNAVTEGFFTFFYIVYKKSL